METFFTGITNFGFPIALSAFLIYGYINILTKLSDAIIGEHGMRSWMRELTKAVLLLADNSLTKENERELINVRERLDKLEDKEC